MFRGPETLNRSCHKSDFLSSLKQDQQRLQLGNPGPLGRRGPLWPAGAHLCVMAESGDALSGLGAQQGPRLAQGRSKS